MNKKYVEYMRNIERPKRRQKKKKKGTKNRWHTQKTIARWQI